jgi:hypothetical protein
MIHVSSFIYIPLDFNLNFSCRSQITRRHREIEKSKSFLEWAAYTTVTDKVEHEAEAKVKMKGPSRFVRHHRYPKCEIHGRKWHWVIKY